ncbi:MAG: T9SS type A sorting domain-containing protein [Bacteroidota bacterium]
MLRYLLTMLSVVACLSSYGQKIRFTDSTNEWKIFLIHGWPITHLTSYCNYIKDTVRNGKNYKIIRGSVCTPSGLCLVREDTSSKKVYSVIIPDFSMSDFDTSEQILYDYNWQLGDTVVRTVRNYFKHVISEIDSTDINGVWHKVWHFHEVYSDESSSDFDVIEGIGCTRDPLFPLIPGSFESHIRLSCFTNRYGTPPVAPIIGHFNNISSCTLEAEDLPSANSETSVVPNPITEFSKIILPGKTQTGSIVVYNALGQAVVTLSVDNTTEILIGDKITVQGLYWYRVTTEGCTSYTGKFVR